jgi:hypothetical protein
MLETRTKVLSKGISLFIKTVDLDESCSFAIKGCEGRAGHNRYQLILQNSIADSQELILILKFWIIMRLEATVSHPSAANIGPKFGFSRVYFGMRTSVIIACFAATL